MHVIHTNSFVDIPTAGTRPWQVWETENFYFCELATFIYFTFWGLLAKYFRQSNIFCLINSHFNFFCLSVFRLPISLSTKKYTDLTFIPKQNRNLHVFRRHFCKSNSQSMLLPFSHYSLIIGISKILRLIVH